MILDSQLTWKDHIEYISSKARRKIGVMKALKYKISRKAHEMIYQSNILSIFDYGCMLYDGSIKQNLKQLDEIHLEAHRIISGAKKRTSTNNLSKETGYYQLSQRRIYFKIITLFKILYNESPIYLKELVSKWSNGNIFRRNNILLSKLCRTEMYKRSFFSSAIQIWNNSNTEIKHYIT